MQGYPGFPGSPGNLTFGTMPYFPQVHTHPELQVPYPYPMHRPPAGMHQGYDPSFAQGPYGMPPNHMGFPQGVFPPPVRGAYPPQQQPQHRGNQNQQRGYQGGMPGSGPGYRPNQQAAGKRPPGGGPQQNGAALPHPTEKRVGRLSIVNPETNKEIEIPQPGTIYPLCITPYHFSELLRINFKFMYPFLACSTILATGFWALFNCSASRIVAMLGYIKR